MAANKNAASQISDVRATAGLDGATSLAWDDLLRELRLAHRVIKHFRQPANTQELILRAFQKAGWPRSIPNPLTTTSRPRLRLREAVKNLNRAQRWPGVHFHVNHGSSLIYWTLDQDAKTSRIRSSSRRRER